ncbi:rhomboid-like protein [Actinomycetospora rhizophila]|uniref:Rhomboid-like protein n=1 Tax=Actinomycetospora rhizophila TaxID=1416876 RepID=A0ABV9ZCU3_9PSEU
MRVAGRALRTWVRAGPVTAAYLGALVATHVVLAATGTGPAARAWSSTNVDNLRDHPLGALATSPFHLGNSGEITPGTVAIVGVGIGGAMWWLEARRGVATAAAAFAGGHVGATVLTVPLILAAVDGGVYPASVLSAVDVGVSYGAQAAAAAATTLLPRWAGVAGALVVAGWPLLDAEWSRGWPDFTSVGHLVAAGIGFGMGPALRRAARSAGPGPC